MCRVGISTKLTLLYFVIIFVAVFEAYSDDEEFYYIRGVAPAEAFQHLFGQGSLGRVANNDFGHTGLAKDWPAAFRVSRSQLDEMLPNVSNEGRIVDQQAITRLAVMDMYGNGGASLQRARLEDPRNKYFREQALEQFYDRGYLIVFQPDTKTSQYPGFWNDFHEDIVLVDPTARAHSIVPMPRELIEAIRGPDRRIIPGKRERVFQYDSGDSPIYTASSQRQFQTVTATRKSRDIGNIEIANVRDAIEPGIADLSLFQQVNKPNLSRIGSLRRSFNGASMVAATAFSHPRRTTRAVLGQARSIAAPRLRTGAMVGVGMGVGLLANWGTQKIIDGCPEMQENLQAYEDVSAEAYRRASNPNLSFRETWSDYLYIWAEAMQSCAF
ncbi:MAG: hypothetical protein KDD60_10305 [Bdellovibrionales bacterium]|nr:hypothetical protein [Bdellovibrionales bacterium]